MMDVGRNSGSRFLISRSQPASYCSLTSAFPKTRQHHFQHLRQPSRGDGQHRAINARFAYMHQSALLPPEKKVSASYFQHKAAGRGVVRFLLRIGSSRVIATRKVGSFFDRDIGETSTCADPDMA